MIALAVLRRCCTTLTLPFNTERMQRLRLETWRGEGVKMEVMVMVMRTDGIIDYGQDKS